MSKSKEEKAQYMKEYRAKKNAQGIKFYTPEQTKKRNDKALEDKETLTIRVSPELKARYKKLSIDLSLNYTEILEQLMANKM